MSSLLTDEDRASILERVANDPVVIAMDALRLALRRLIQYPSSLRRQDAFFAAWEDVNTEYVNRLMGTTGSLIVAPLETLRAHMTRIESHMGRLEYQMEDLHKEIEALRLTREANH